MTQIEIRGGPRRRGDGRFGARRRARAGLCSCISLTVIVSVLCAAAASAQTVAVDPAEGDVVIVTGTAEPIPAEAVGSSVSVFPGEQIEASGYTYIGDVLRQIPGLAVNRAGPFGGFTQVRIRGAEGNHTLVLFDGVDVSEAGGGETDLSSLVSADVERIEVLRGPQSGLYGSNALAGVVNVITRRETDGRYINAGIEGGSFDTWRVEASGGVGDGANYLSGAASLLGTEGFDSSAGGAFNGPPSIDGDREGNELATAYIRGGRRISPVLSVRGFARYVDKSSELDGFDFSGVAGRQGRTFDDASFLDTQDWNLSGEATLSLKEGDWVTTASASHTDSTSDGGSFGGEASRTSLMLKSSHRFGAAGFLQRLTGFIDHETETFRNTRPFTPDQAPEQERTLIGAGVQYQAEIADQVFLLATGRVDDNDDFDGSETFGVSAAWAVPGSGWRLHASAGTGVTNPTFFEQFGFFPGQFIGNPDLKPEEAFGWDAGVERRFAGGRLIVDLTYFRSTLENEIMTRFPPPDFLGTPVNDAGESDREGFEASFSVFPTDAVDLIGSFTRVDSTDPGGSPEVRRPETLASLDANFRFLDGRGQLTLGVTHNGEQFDNDFTGGFAPVKTTVDAYTLLRFAARYNLTDRIEVYGRIENLTDEDYEEALGFQTPGSSVHVGLRYRFEQGR